MSLRRVQQIVAVRRAKSTPSNKPRPPARATNNDAADESWLCAICTDPISDPAIGGGCTHHYCYDCLSTWAATPNATCPVCRTPVLRVIRDPEFASSIGVKSKGGGNCLSNDEVQQLRATWKEARMVSVSWPPGISLGARPEPRPDRPRGGVLINQVLHGNGAHRAGVRDGELLLSVNGIVVTDHQAAIQLIERHAACGNLRLQVTPFADTEDYDTHHDYVHDPPRAQRNPLRQSFMVRSASSGPLGSTSSASLENLEAHQALLWGAGLMRQAVPAPRVHQMLPREPLLAPGERSFFRVPALHGTSRRRRHTDRSSSPTSATPMTVYRDGEPQGPPIGSAPSEAETLDQQLEESEEEARSRRFGFYMRSSAGDAEEAGSDDDSIDTRQRVGHSLESAQQLLDSAGTYGGDTGLDVELHSARAAAEAAADEQQSLQEFLQWSEESDGAPPATLRAMPESPEFRRGVRVPGLDASVDEMHDATLEASHDRLAEQLRETLADLRDSNGEMPHHLIASQERIEQGLAEIRQMLAGGEV